MISEFPTSRHLTLLNAKKPPDAPKKQHAQTGTGFIPNIFQPLELNCKQFDFPNFPNRVLIRCGWTPFRMDIVCIDVLHEKSACSCFHQMKQLGFPLAAKETHDH